MMSDDSLKFLKVSVAFDVSGVEPEIVEMLHKELLELLSSFGKKRGLHYMSFESGVVNQSAIALTGGGNSGN